MELKTVFFTLILLGFINLYKCKKEEICPKLAELGCYKGLSGRTQVLNQLLENGRLRNSKYRIRWGTYNKTVSSLLCHCARYAEENGFNVFGVHYFGECWGTKKTFDEFQHLAQPSKSCLNGEFQSCTDKFPCIGTSDGTYIYTIKKEASHPVDGGYTEWSDWSACPAFCGVGLQERHRVCTNPVPQNGGNHCEGESEDVQECRNELCFEGGNKKDQCQVSQGEEFNTMFTYGRYRNNHPFCLEYGQEQAVNPTVYDVFVDVHSVDEMGTPSLGLFYNALDDSNYEFVVLHLSSRFHCLSIGRVDHGEEELDERTTHQCNYNFSPGEWISLHLYVGQSTAELYANERLLQRWNTRTKNTGVGGVLVKLETVNYQVNFMNLMVE